MAVQYGDQQKMLTLYVVKGHGPSLLGHDWLCSIQLDWKSIGQVTMDTSTKNSSCRNMGTFSERNSEQCRTSKLN